MKKIILHIITCIKYFGAVKGFFIVIKNSKISATAKVFNDVMILNSSVGKETWIYNNSTLSNATLAGNNKIGKRCKFSNGVLGRYSYIADECFINNTNIGNFCSIGMGLRVGLGTHPVNFISSSPFFYSTMSSGEVVFEEYAITNIGHDVWIGTNVFLKDGITIGNGAIIGAGSVVLKDVGDFEIVGGVPAKHIRYRHSEGIIKKIKDSNWWVKDTEWLKLNIKNFQRPISSEEDISI